MVFPVVVLWLSYGWPSTACCGWPCRGGCWSRWDDARHRNCHEGVATNKNTRRWSRCSSLCPCFFSTNSCFPWVFHGLSNKKSHFCHWFSMGSPFFHMFPTGFPWVHNFSICFPWVFHGLSNKHIFFALDFPWVHHFFCTFFLWFFRGMLPKNAHVGSTSCFAQRVVLKRRQVPRRRISTPPCQPDGCCGVLKSAWQTEGAPQLANQISNWQTLIHGMMILDYIVSCICTAMTFRTKTGHML